MSTRTTPKPRVSDVTLSRSYDQWCPIAVGLDLLGDRWTLLIVRELLFDDQRFTDLRTALPGLAPNLLSDRLKTLVDIGLVVTVELPPPAARSVYRLTEDGRAAAPVLRSLARFGVRHLAGTPGPAMDARRAANALVVPWYRPDDTDGTRPRRVRLIVTSSARTEPSAADMVLARPIEIERVDLAAAGLPAPDVVITTTVEALAAARRDGAPLRDRLAGSKADVAAVRAALSI